MTQQPNSLDRLVANARQFCSLPAVAMQVLELTNNPAVDTQALKQCLENDPALTTKVLRVVNSSLFGLSRQVSSLNQALALLGIKPLKLLVLGFSLPAELFRGLAGEVLASYWRHTLTKAVAAREIAETLWRQSGDEAFLAGLLQDLGLLLLIQELGPPYLELLAKIKAQGADLLAWEERSLGFDHTTLTARILEHWGLPHVLVEAVEFRDGEVDSAAMFRENADLRQILRMAELLAQVLADGRAEALGPLLEIGQQCCHLTAARLDELVSTLEEKVRQLADVLSLQLPPGVEYVDVLSRAHRQLAETASQLAVELAARQHRQAAFRPQRDNPAEPEEGLQALGTAVAEAARRRQPLERRAAETPASGSASDPNPCGTVPAGAEFPALGTSPLRSSSPSSALGSSPALQGRLLAAVAACRQARCALSLLLVELLDADALVASAGPEGFRWIRHLLETACLRLDHAGMACVPHGEAGFALVLPDCERQMAVGLGNVLVDQMRRLSSTVATGRSQAVLAVGAATVSLPPRNFPPDALFQGANRCLSGSRMGGGTVVKSIEIY